MQTIQSNMRGNLVNKSIFRIITSFLVIPNLVRVVRGRALPLSRCQSGMDRCDLFLFTRMGRS